METILSLDGSEKLEFLCFQDMRDMCTPLSKLFRFPTGRIKELHAELEMECPETLVYHRSLIKDLWEAANIVETTCYDHDIGPDEFSKLGSELSADI